MFFHNRNLNEAFSYCQLIFKKPLAYLFNFHFCQVSFEALYNITNILCCFTGNYEHVKRFVGSNRNCDRRYNCLRCLFVGLSTVILYFTFGYRGFDLERDLVVAFISGPLHLE